MSSPLALPPAIAAVAPDGDLTPRRRIMIELCLRRQRPGTGSSLEFLRKKTAVNQWPDLRPVLKDIPWAIGGGVATRAYMPERMTQDVAVLVRWQDCQAAWQRFQEAGFAVAP